MKHLITKIAALFMVAALLGCHKKQGDVAQKTIVAGKVTNWQKHPDVKEYTLTVVDFSGNEGYVGVIRNDGTFEIVFEQFIAEDVSLDHHVGTFIAHPGDSIHIDIDLDNMSSFKFSGDAARTNADINKYTSEYYSQYERSSLAYTSPVDYKASCDNVKAELLNKLVEFSAKAEPNDETKVWINNYITIQYYKLLFEFPFQYALHNHLKTMAKLPKGLIDVHDLENAKTAAILNSDYYPLALNYLSSYWFPAHASNRTTNIKAAAKELNKQLAGNDLFRQIVLGHVLNGGMLDNNIEFYTNHKADVEPYLQSFIKQALADHRNKIEGDFKNRQALSNATLKKLVGTPAQNMIDSIRKAHKGKVVYFDFWSTWCGPCIGEIKRIKKMEQSLADSNVVFVGICIDSDRKDWEKFKAGHDMPGEQYFAVGKQAAAMRQAFKIEGVPQSMLMDQNGDIVQSNLYLRASNATEKKINTLLGKTAADKGTTIKLNPIK